MLFFTVKVKDNEFPNIILNARNFHYKAREIVFGSNNYITHPTAYYELEDIHIDILGVDIEPEEINRVVFEYYNSIGKGHLFQPVYNNTLKEKYTLSFLEQDFDFYQNLCDNYSVEKVAKVIYWYIYKQASIDIIYSLLGIDKEEIIFMLEYLPIYYNFLTKEEEWHGLHNGR